MVVPMADKKVEHSAESVAEQKAAHLADWKAELMVE